MSNGHGGWYLVTEKQHYLAVDAGLNKISTTDVDNSI